MGRRARAPTSGSASAGFPNLFTITGPGSPSVLTNMLPSIEQHVDWIADCIGYLRDARPRRASRPTLEAEDAWVAHVNDDRRRHAVPDVQLLVPRRQRAGQAARVHALLGFPPYVEKCDEVAANGYDGFALS